MFNFFRDNLTNGSKNNAVIKATIIGTDTGRMIYPSVMISTTIVKIKILRRVKILDNLEPLFCIAL